jgi:hypothetical protein
MAHEHRTTDRVGSRPEPIAPAQRPALGAWLGWDRPGWPGRRCSSPARWRSAGTVLFLLQLAWLLAISVRLFDRFSLTSDDALFVQAWHLVAAGHLSPTTTIYRSAPFLTNHFELLLYPLALFQYADPSGLVLLVLQDLATVAAELVAFFWITELVAVGWGGRPGGRHAVLGGSLLVLLLDPWPYWADAYDFHLQVFAALFSLLAFRALWRRRWGPAAGWTALTFCCGTVESVVLIGIGLGLVITRRDLWRQGLGLAAATVAWVLSLNALGYDAGSQLASKYAYLTGTSPGATVHVTQVALGALRHPHRVASMLNAKRTQIWHILAGPGLLGLVSGVGLLVSLVLLLPAALNAQYSVIQPEAAFQVFPLYVLLPVGGVLVVCWLSRQARPWPALGLLVGLAAVVEAAVLGGLWIPRAEPFFDQISPGAARVLSSVLDRTPADAEVIASNGFVGRFAARRFVYAYEAPTAATGSVPVRSKTVVLVLSAAQGIETVPPSATRAAIGQIRQRLSGRVLADASGIFAFLWQPGPDVRRLSLPGL